MKSRGVVVTALVSALAVLGAPAQADGHVQTFAVFNEAVPELPEGVAVDKRGDVYVSVVAPVRQIRRISPDGTQSVLVDFTELGVEGLGPAGLTVAADGTVYVAVVGVDFQTLTTLEPGDPRLPDTHGVYRVRPDGTAEHLTGTQELLFPNDVTLDKRGNVYVTDTIGGSVWRVPRRGAAELWARHELLEGDERFGLGVPFGANGIAVRHQTVVVANTERGLLVELATEPDGSAAAPRVVAAAPALVGIDGIAFDVLGRIYAAVNIQHTVVRVDGDGTTLTLATAEDGLDQPSTLAFGTAWGGNRTLYVANFSFFSQCCPALLTLPVGQPGQPVP